MISFPSLLFVPSPNCAVVTHAHQTPGEGGSDQFDIFWGGEIRDCVRSILADGDLSNGCLTLGVGEGMGPVCVERERVSVCVCVCEACACEVYVCVCEECMCV